MGPPVTMEGLIEQMQGESSGDGVVGPTREEFDMMKAQLASIESTLVKLAAGQSTPTQTAGVDRAQVDKAVRAATDALRALPSVGAVRSRRGLMPGLPRRSFP